MKFHANALIAICITLFMFSSTPVIAGDLELRRKMAMEIVQIAKDENILDYTIDTILSNLETVQQTKMKKLLAKHLDGEEFYSRWIDIFADVFSEEELSALVGFYSTPIGRSIARNRMRANARVASTLSEMVRASIEKEKQN